MEVITRSFMTMPKNKWVCPRCHGQLKAGTSSAIRSSLWRSQARSFHRSRPLRENYSGETQAQPLGDFYTDLLAKPIPNVSNATSSLPAFVQSGDETREVRAKKLFGNIRGSGYDRHTFDKPDETWHTINGVPIPPRPPEPDNCCMSGCVHCVWDDYRDDIEGWAARVHEAQAKSMEQGATNTPKIHMPRPEVSQASGSMDDDGGGSEGLWTTSSGGDEGEALFGGIPIGIREFMATEKRIRERRRAKEGKR